MMPGNGSLLRVGLLVSLAGAGAVASDDITPERPYYGSGFATFGIGPCQHGVTNVSFTGGADGFVWRGLTAGGELGYYRFVENNARPFGIGNLNLGYHFVNRKNPGKIEPFVSAGVLGAGFGGSGIAASGGLSGGVNYWFNRRVGLRTEVRVTGVAEEAIVLFRVGLSFR